MAVTNAVHGPVQVAVFLGVGVHHLPEETGL
jgi:hypothetical protein